MEHFKVAENGSGIALGGNWDGSRNIQTGQVGVMLQEDPRPGIIIDTEETRGLQTMDGIEHALDRGPANQRSNRLIYDLVTVNY